MDHLKVLSGTTTSQSNNNGGNSTRTRKCYHCNGTDHAPFNCPNIAAWRKEEKPKDNEPQEKTVESVLYKYCGKCRQGKGFWTAGKPIHTTAEHKGKNWNKSTTPAATPTAPEPEAGLMGVITEAPIEVDFG
jgi:hypothetical protein